MLSCQAHQHTLFFPITHFEHMAALHFIKESSGTSAAKRKTQQTQIISRFFQPHIPSINSLSCASSLLPSVHRLMRQNFFLSVCAEHTVKMSKATTQDSPFLETIPGIILSNSIFPIGRAENANCIPANAYAHKKYSL